MRLHNRRQNWPGVALTVEVCCLNLFGDAVRHSWRRCWLP